MVAHQAPLSLGFSRQDHWSQSATGSLQEDEKARMRIHSRPPGTTGTQGCQPPSRSHCVRLRPHLGCAFAEGWVPSSRAPDPTGSPSSAASQESGAQAGVPGWLPLCSFSPHLGKAFPPSRGLRVRFPPRWKVPPRGPQRRAPASTRDEALFHCTEPSGPPDRDRRGDSPAWSGRGSRPSRRTSG